MVQWNLRRQGFTRAKIKPVPLSETHCSCSVNGRPSVNTAMCLRQWDSFTSIHTFAFTLTDFWRRFLKCGRRREWNSWNKITRANALVPLFHSCLVSYIPWSMENFQSDHPVKEVYAIHSTGVHETCFSKFDYKLCSLIVGGSISWTL